MTKGSWLGESVTLSLLCRIFPHFHTSEKCGTKDEKKRRDLVASTGHLCWIREQFRGWKGTLLWLQRSVFKIPKIYLNLGLYVAPSNRSKGKLYSTDQFLSERKALVFKETSLLVRSFPTLPSIQSQAIAKPRIRLALPGSSFPRTEVTR